MSAASVAPPRKRHVDLEAWSFRLVMGSLAGLTLLLLIAPSVIVVVTSFTDSFSLKFPPPGYSVRWYADLLTAEDLKRPAWNSLTIAAVATAVATVLGVTGALVLGRRAATWARALDAAFMSPLILPQFAFGLAALMYFSLLAIPLSVTVITLGHIVVCAPFVLRTTAASVAQLDPALLESSASLGARAFYTFRRVTLPMIRNGILAGAFLAFMASFDNVPVSLFLSDARTEVLPIRLWQILEASLDVRAAAVSGVLIVSTALLILVMERLSGLSRQLR